MCSKYSHEGFRLSNFSVSVIFRRVSNSNRVTAALPAILLSKTSVLVRGHETDEIYFFKTDNSRLYYVRII